MHGLINKAIEGFVVEIYGAGAWQSIVTEAETGAASFEAMLVYDDVIAERLLEATAAHLNKPRPMLLEDIGTFLVSHPRMPALRRLLRFAGTEFEDFLHSLEDLPGRVRLAVPDFILPSMEITHKGARDYELSCGPLFEGFGHVMVGLLQAMADEYGALVTIEHHGPGPGAGGETSRGLEVISIRLHVPQFSEGRRFALGVGGG